MPRCLISFGANLGNALETIQRSAELLRQELQCAAAFRLSRFFRTPPVGGPGGQPPFVNAVAAAETPLSAIQVWQAIRNVEQELGRERNRRWEARRIDLDILLYEQLRLWTPQLKIPHPRMCMRRFILVPALDVAAEWTDPVSGLSIRRLADSLQAGAGSLRVIPGDSPAEPFSQTTRDMVDQVAEQAMATMAPAPAAATRGGLHTAPPTETRWLSLVPLEELVANNSLRPAAKLTMFLAPKLSNPNLVWEEAQAAWAQRLNLTAGQADRAAELPLDGPRYLLASDDEQWAVHEMVAALEAMDCPIEPIPR
ncbi:MAG: 2-amino-4-hydroxy-6-hydroxymethyldihydropteridine diphosphokinase [Planctomycetales bacterium]|nr:2-amino-4-hydroxy-6-hydroxymethyldihydropteridine diphosphokinase [Planctomycetales bacterium]